MASEGELSKLDCDILKADSAELRTRCLIWRRSFVRLAIIASGKFATDRRLTLSSILKHHPPPDHRERDQPHDKTEPGAFVR